MKMGATTTTFNGFESVCVRVKVTELCECSHTFTRKFTLNNVPGQPRPPVLAVMLEVSSARNIWEILGAAMLTRPLRLVAAMPTPEVSRSHEY